MTNKRTEEKVCRVLGEAIAERRRTVGLSQEKLAFEVGMDLTSINEIEKGHRSPRFTTVYKIAKALKVKTTYLVNKVDAEV